MEETRQKSDFYATRIIAAMRTIGGPATRNQILHHLEKKMRQDRLGERLRDLEDDGRIIRGSVVKMGHTFTTWSLAIPQSIISRMSLANDNGHAQPVADDRPSIGVPVLNYLDAVRIAEDLLSGIESLRIQAENLKVSIQDWPSLPIRKLIEMHCLSTGKEFRSAISDEVLPILAEMCGKIPV